MCFIFREKERDRRKRDDDRPSATTPNVATTKPVKGLSESQRDRFEDMLRTLLPDRNPIAETMVSFTTLFKPVKNKKCSMFKFK